LLKNFSNFQEFSSENVDEIVAILCDLLVQNPKNAENIKNLFSPLLLPIVSSFLEDSGGDFVSFQRQCIALSILSEGNRQVLG
jgi:hypothetical protein